jgi:DNA-directed RNA polymerase specialized sigma24 family protein
MRTAATLDAEAFHGLLQRLDPDPDRAAHAYEELRFRLVRLFRWRGCEAPEELADTTLDRVARKVQAGEPIQDPRAYAVGVARMVVLESRRSEARTRDAMAELGRQPIGASPAGGKASECLTSCLGELPVPSRRLLLDYYADANADKVEHRKALADRMGIPLNALRIRVCRLRTRLEECMQGCVGGRWR